ncbi:hypothetical protein PRIPAC_87293 [Pristionchus pacificus]|uniref:Uncharacterized protein n=1 Tax=Pristionchus pacificus TaxID=54126 RepID=A0A2A6B879_PRIPA|nr:hypothetical protein PRIPAC_87293 [Pristionchus pacificus]|eukprot:PDM62078.1 hypothetical protein PRIPAC_51520 [Pristionchus pacificus]
MQYKRSIDNSLNCSTKADSHRKYVCYSGRIHIAEDVAYRRRRGVSPKTWRIAEDVAYRRRRGVSPKTWCIAEDVIN